MPWTPEQVELLRKSWAEGKSATVIAIELGIESRSAVIGKAFRLHLASRKTSVRAKSRKPTKFNFASNKAKSEAPKAEPEPFVSRETVVTPEHQRILFEDLVDGCCKYAHGDHPPYSFCGAKSVAPGVSWCPTHFHVVTGAPHPSQRVEQPLRKLEAVP